MSYLQERANEIEAHMDHGRGTADDGPDSSDCPCRVTDKANICARAGCGFCRAEVAMLDGRADEEPTGEHLVESDFELELAHLLNRYSQENGSDTPDYILANYLLNCLNNYNVATTERERWYGRPTHEAPITLANSARMTE